MALTFARLDPRSTEPPNAVRVEEHPRANGMRQVIVFSLLADDSVAEMRSLFGEQLIAVGAVLVFSFAVSYAIGAALKAILPGGIRATEDHEDLGLDITQHAENGYALERV